MFQNRRSIDKEKNERDEWKEYFLFNKHTFDFVFFFHNRALNLQLDKFWDYVAR